MEYGIVNPFALDMHFLSSELIQIFDRSLMEERQAPYTMMTNAGDLTWAVEFKPEELINAIDNRKPTIHPAPAACTLILKNIVMMVNTATRKLAPIKMLRIRSLISIFEWNK